jgi:alkylhydroperoxidase family enzyme
VHRLNDNDINRLRPYYKDLQILEIVFSVAGNNAINRWKEALGLPQEKEASRFLRRGAQPLPKDRPLPIKSFRTPTSEKYKSRTSLIAPVRPAGAAGEPARLAAVRRPPLETRAYVELAYAACRTRTPRLPLVDEATARALLPKEWSSEPLPQWVRLLANFPRDGKARILGLRAAEEKGDLKPLLKAQVAWISARHDRAWYALGLARQRLLDLGYSEDDLYKLDGSWNEYTPAERAAFSFARTLTVTPDLLTDNDVTQLRKHYCDRDVVQLLSYVTDRAFFNRVTEASGLQLEK